MAAGNYSTYLKVLSLYLALLFLISFLVSSVYAEADQHFGPTRRILELEDEDKPIKKKTTSSNSGSGGGGSSSSQPKSSKSTTTSSSKNQTKLIKTTPGGGSGAPKNQTKLLKTTTSESTKNKTKLIKPKSDSSKDTVPSLKSPTKKLNSTSKSSSNSTKSSTSLHTTKSSDLSSPKNKTTKPLTTKDSKAQVEKTNQSKSKDKTQSTEQKTKSQKIQKKLTKPSWIDDDDDEDDLVAEFRDLPSKFQETFLPDLDRISKTSQVYLTRYNKEITKGVKPLVGNKYAHTIASLVSFAFIIIPLILGSLIFNRITAYFSLQKLLIFIQVYLSIYFSILCLSSLATGLEPLKFFYATSQSTYVCLQVLQTLAYVLYLLLLLMYLILVFSTETGLFTKLLGLGQTFVGFAVGLHYYMKVFHRAVLRQPPKTSWKVHALYATCFLVVCLLSRADRRKKAYLEEGGEEGKKN